MRHLIIELLFCLVLSFRPLNLMALVPSSIREKVDLLTTDEDSILFLDLSASNHQKGEIDSEMLKEIIQMLEEGGILDKIIYLNVNNHLVDEIPKEISKLSNLETLYLRNNEIKQIPETLCLLPALQELDLTSNKLSSDSQMIISKLESRLSWSKFGTRRTDPTPPQPPAPSTFPKKKNKHFGLIY